MMNNRFQMKESRTRQTKNARRVRDAQMQAGEMLLRLGMTPHTEGYAMLRDGTRFLACVDRGRHVQITRELYPLIEASFGRSEQKSEHAMRDTIRLAWQRNGEERAALYFDDVPPSNAELLYMLAEQLKTVCGRM